MHVLRAVFLIFLQSTLSALVAASESPPTALGRACSTTNRLDPRTRRFTSDCDAQTFCSSSGTINGTCVPRQCRREEFLSGHGTNQTVPVLCPAGSFCPDEGDACRPLAPVGQPCQFNRDDQCAPSDAPELADYHNFDGSVCLHSICTYANATEKQPCVFELSTYPEIDVSGTGYLNTVVRDNCITAQFFCDTTTQFCERLRLIGQQCQYHRSCKSYNCLQNVCASPPEEPFEVALWQYAVTTLAVVLGNTTAMAAICIMLVMMHRRHRLKHYQEIYEYCDEQIRLRQSVLRLRARSERNDIAKMR